MISFAIGLAIALICQLARLSPNRILQGAARFYISIIRGTPLLVQLFIVFFALPELGVKIDLAAVIAFSLNVGGYAAEIIRSKTPSPGGSGKPRRRSANYTGTLQRSILPQAARVAVPLYCRTP